MTWDLPIGSREQWAEQVLDRDGLVAYFASMSWIADLPDVDRLPLLDEVRSRLEADEYRRVWETLAYSTRLR